MSDAESDRQAEVEEGTAALLEEEGPGLREEAPDGEGTAALLEEDEPPVAGAAAGCGGGDGASPSKPAASAGTAEEDEGAASLLTPSASPAYPPTALCASTGVRSSHLHRRPLMHSVDLPPADVALCPAACPAEEYRGDEDDADNEATIEEEELLAAAEGRDVKVRRHEKAVGR